MKLLTKTTLYFLVAMVILLFSAGYFLFSQVSKELDQQTDQELLLDEGQWIQYLEGQAEMGTTFLLRTPDLAIYPTDVPVMQYPSFSQTTGMSPRQKKEVPYRQLSHTVSISGIPYQIIIRRSQEQKLVFVSNITRTMLLVFAAMFVVTLLINWLISRNIWKPFTRSLQKIRGAELQKMEAIHFEHSGITEFNDLNNSLNYMTGKIYRDYLSMKEFTENAAHEMQTPLAVAQSKMEILLQDANITDDQAKSITDAQSALSRLSNLNQSLLMLARIDNNQYATNEPLVLNKVIEKYLQLFDEIIKSRLLKIDAHQLETFEINMHPLLAESLISNLLGNAIKYNFEGGRVVVTTTKDTLVIANTSHQKQITTDQLFKRFYSNSTSNGTGNGLGLAIVKKICDTHRLAINYSFNNGLHQFEIKK